MVNDKHWLIMAIEEARNAVTIDVSDIPLMQKIGKTELKVLPMTIDEMNQLKNDKAIKDCGRDKEAKDTLMGSLMIWHRIQKAEPGFPPFEIWKDLPQEIQNAIGNKIQKALSGRGIEDFLR